MRERKMFLRYMDNAITYLYGYDGSFKVDEREGRLHILGARILASRTNIM